MGKVINLKTFYKRCFLVFIFFTSSLTLIIASEFTFILKDGSRLSGSMICFENGTYRIKTKSLGEISINVSEIEKILPSSENNSNKEEISSKINNIQKQTYQKNSNVKNLKIIEEVNPQKTVVKQTHNNYRANDKSNEYENNSTLLSNRNNLIKMQSQINMLIKSLLSDESFFEKVLKIQSLPQFQEIINDSTILESIDKGDYNSLMKNQKILDLINTSEMREILDLVE